jgi:hypothetical protein
MNPNEMKPGVRYVVTKASDDGTFEVGDHISLDAGGSITCVEAQGWIDAEDVPDATVGMECEIDAEWLARKRAKLMAELEAME